ncbi:extracellular solute-binding protein [Seminavis robusta]|uniref:Extracellular solute-binding protein n=1 Tax=Seminavis robusta TaxID=568900 RepID=A0A9N8HZZ2_9STRA|nr:extracellular solute-binding protein [Seminavis robusta]|eukprot:Sro2435_g327550.1 extracellular solute-binding protein (844) ;mRNA; r:3045-5743
MSMNGKKNQQRPLPDELLGIVTPASDDIVEPTADCSVTKVDDACNENCGKEVLGLEELEKIDNDIAKIEKKVNLASSKKTSDNEVLVLEKLEKLDDDIEKLEKKVNLSSSMKTSDETSDETSDKTSDDGSGTPTDGDQAILQLGGEVAPLPAARPRRQQQGPGAYSIVGINGATTANDDASIQVTSDRPRRQPNIEQATQDSPLEASLVIDRTQTQGQIRDIELGRPRQERPRQEPTFDAVIVHHDGSKRRTVLVASSFLVLAAIIVALIMGLLGVFDSSDDSPKPQHPSVPKENIVDSDSENVSSTAAVSTLERIRKEGVLRCERRTFDGASETMLGYQDSWCLAVAAGILGPNATTEFRESNDPKAPLFGLLLDEHVDLYTSGYTHSLERDVFQTTGKEGLAFSSPHLHMGTSTGGDPHHVSCTENGFAHINECADLKICVSRGTTFFDFLSAIVPRRAIVEVDGLYLGGAFAEGLCNVVYSSLVTIPSIEAIRGLGFDGPYRASEQVFAPQPLSHVTRQDDTEFTAFVGAIVDALKVAERYNITQSTAESFPLTDVFGKEYQRMFQHALAAAGNHGEIHHRHLSASGFPKPPLELVNIGATPLLFSYPFGGISQKRDSDFPLDDAMLEIIKRGFVRCAIRLRPGFAVVVENEANQPYYEGMDADLCRALSAGLFQGSTDMVEFVHVETPEDGYVLLANGKVDVFAGATKSLQTTVREPTTGTGFAFSTPYFFGYSEDEDNTCLASRLDAHDWREFVFWTVMGVVHAEENGIDKATSNLMPEVFSFGDQFNRMFRDSVLAVGNYGELYERNLESLVPRGGRNMLNQSPHQGPQHYALPGFL